MARKILVVDDNAINRQMLINVLGADYDIIEAENGKEALTVMNRNYKLLSAVLLDIVMPELDGYEVLRIARDNAMLSQIPIIIITGSEDEESRVKALSYGANDFILKPFNPEIVRHCLRNNIALRETASILNAIQKDKLTGLYNREAFFEHAGTLIRERESGAYLLACFDIDNFKLINDQYGAAEGDHILKEVANYVKSGMEKVGGVAGRISADNFAVLFLSEKENYVLLQKMQEQLLSKFVQHAIVFSIGCYVISDTTLAASAVYDRAYIAKQSVKGRYDKHIAYFDEAMLQKLVRDQQIANDMEAALAGRQFEVWFQPQYNHVTGALIGSEALVRWRHPQKGIILPGEFIPLFEQNGFVYELDKYVWRETCRYLRRWLDKGLSPLPVSVNISRYDIFRSDLLDVITNIVKEYDIPTQLLRLEVTESAFARSTKLIVDIVKRLISLGFVIEIDDFGSGYSSLNTLKNVPAQIVKLDMRFLEGGDDAQRGGNILESVVRMAKWLGMSVIAEGVETIHQGDFLKSIGCICMQGYLYAKPMPAECYESLLQSSEKDGGLSVLEMAGNLNNNLFWNPDSMDSLIFNSFVGSACICEYHDGVIELLRATDKYAHMLGGADMTVDELLKLDIMKHIDKTRSAPMLEMIAASVNSKEEFTGELLFVDLPGRPREIFVRSSMRVIASAEERCLVYCISEDITAQRLSERKERSLTKQLRLIMDNVNCGITAVTITNEKTNFLLANDKYYELLGYTKQQHQQEVGSNGYLPIFPEDRARVQAVTEQTMLSGKPASVEFRAIRRDGSTVWLRSFLSMTSFEGIDEPVQLCTYADITAQRSTAQSLLDNLPCGAGICSVTENDTRMVYVNKRYLSYFKHSSRTHHDGSVFDVIHPDDRAKLRSAMRPALAGGEGSCVVRIMDGPDDYIAFRISGVASEPSRGGNSIYVTFIPISLEALSFSEMLPVALAKMMASSTDLSFVKDISLRYICCSRAFAHMVGLESEVDIVGKTDYDLFESDFADRYVTDDRKLIESGKSIIDMVEAIPSEDGKHRYSSTSKYLLYDSSGNVIGLYGTGHDVTDTREAVAQQRFLINNIPGGVAVYEGQWSTLDSISLLYFSDGFCSLFGFTREEYEKLGSKKPTSLMFEEYIPGLISQIEALIETGTPIDYIYRARKKDGDSLWLHLKAMLGERHGDNMTVNAVFFDVTEHQNALERLRVSEEENRLAIQHSKNVVCRYDVAEKTLSLSLSVNSRFNLPSLMTDVPYKEIRDGRISPETAAAYAEFYEKIIRGEKSGNAVYQRSSTQGWRWIDANFSTIFSSAGEPVSAVISFLDVTENFEKDAAYKKWMQSLHNKQEDSYSLYRCNITQQKVFDTHEGSLLYYELDSQSLSFYEHSKEYADLCICEDDKQRFLDFLKIDALFDKYRRKERVLTLEYREKTPSSEGFRWLRLTVDLVEYPYSSDIEAYLLFEDIDEAKRAELLTLERAETDPLTGIYNRTAFAEKVDALIGASAPDAKHALLILDIDGFKLVNDTFGHGAGDRSLTQTADMLRRILRSDDLVGRLGGDEFVVFLGNIPDEQVAADKAKRICDMSRKTLSPDVRISMSVGISVCPGDGTNFETLYKKADEALYRVKDSGKDDFAFHSDDMPLQNGAAVTHLADKKRRMLIAEDNKLDYELLANIFQSEFNVERAKNGLDALIRLKHYGTGVSVVLLDLMMPDMDGFEVLEKLRESPELCTIPVVVVSGADDKENSLRAIRGGATDFVTKPVDAEILKVRVFSAISKAENERLIARNSFLELQSAETSRYETVLGRLGLAVAELDWGSGEFSYGPSMSRCLAGRYDSRALWHILMADLVADTETVRRIQQFVHDAAGDRSRTDGSITATLKNHAGKPRRFLINVYKLTNEYGLTNKVILTFNDAGDDTPNEASAVPPDKKEN